MDERVEAAAIATHNQAVEAGSWRQLPEPMKEGRREEMRCAIAAAFPELTGPNPSHMIVPRDIYAELIGDQMWNAYARGIETEGRWFCGGISDAEWLCRMLNLNYGWHDAATVKAGIETHLRAMIAAAEPKEGT